MKLNYRRDGHNSTLKWIQPPSFVLMPLKVVEILRKHVGRVEHFVFEVIVMILHGLNVIVRGEFCWCARGHAALCSCRVLFLTSAQTQSGCQKIPQKGTNAIHFKT